VHASRYCPEKEICVVANLSGANIASNVDTNYYQPSTSLALGSVPVAHGV
jgi:hypothetical protein